MEREYWLQDARQMARPGGIVSVDPCVVASRPAIEIIYKTHRRDELQVHRNARRGVQRVLVSNNRRLRG
jgi:hypothetical protein